MIMNSNSKFQEQEEQILLEQKAVAAAKAALAAKIEYQINCYRMRLSSARAELIQLSSLKPVCLDDYGYLPDIRKRKENLLLEIEFCDGQISAYHLNDNKRKIIPDRLL